MTGPEYKIAIACLGFTQVGIAEWLGISTRSSQHYAAGTVPIPEPTAKLIRLVLRLRLDPADVD